jgi:VWFA-related protein
VPQRAAALGVFLLTAIGIGGAGQLPAPTQPTFRTGVNIVQLDVSVLDAHRVPVRGLTASDFTVIEDGKVRPVVSFAAVEIPGREPPSADWIRDVAADVASNDSEAHRLIVIVMDDVVPHGDPSIIRLGTQVAREIVDQLRPSDLAAVVFTFAGRNQSFTADRHKLLDAIASYRPAPLEVACFLKPTKSCNVDAMNRLADILAVAPPGRKMMFYIGVQPLPPVVSTPVGRVGADDPLDRPKFSMDLFKKLQASNITVDTFDANGLQVTPGEGLEDIRTLAYNTGGRAIVNQNEPWTRVADVFRENDSYYLLGIEAGAKTGHADFHKIRVQTTRAGVTVRTRSGYFEPAVENSKKATRPSSVDARLDAALDTPLPGRGIPIELTVVPFAAPSGKGATLLIPTGIRGSASPTLTGKAAIELVARAYDLEGDPQASYRQSIVVNSESARRYEAIGQLPVKAGRRYEVRVAVSGADRHGSVFADVEIPDFERAPLSLSGVVIASARSGAPPDARIAAVIPVVPLTLRTFRPHDAIVALLRIYRRDKDKSTPGQIVTTILDDHNGKVFEREDPLEAQSRSGANGVDERFDLPLSTLQPGNYLLTFAVSSGKAQASRNVRFSVR